MTSFAALVVFAALAALAAAAYAYMTVRHLRHLDALVEFTRKRMIQLERDRDVLISNLASERGVSIGEIEQLVPYDTPTEGFVEYADGRVEDTEGNDIREHPKVPQAGADVPNLVNEQVAASMADLDLPQPPGVE